MKGPNKINLKLKLNNIDILCLQEVEVESGFNPDLLSIQNYNFEIELNSVKARVGISVKNNVGYTRMRHLEGVDSWLVIIDFCNCAIKRIINVYRSFNLQNNVNARTNKTTKLCQWVSLTYLGKTTVRTYTVNGTRTVYICANVVNNQLTRTLLSEIFYFSIYWIIPPTFKILFCVISYFKCLIIRDKINDWNLNLI